MANVIQAFPKGNGGSEITVDSALSSTSENPVQNKVIAETLNNKADLADGKILANQLPSFVDDVLSYSNLESFPSVGEDGKIYIAKNTNKTYRWSGNDYIEISESLALGETSSTAYRGDRGKTAYNDSQTNKANIGDLTNLVTTEKSNLVGAINEINNNSSIQVTTMPTPVVGLVGKIVEYIGTTNSNYTNGYFYKCNIHTGEPTIVKKVFNTAYPPDFTITADVAQTATSITLGTGQNLQCYYINNVRYPSSGTYQTQDIVNITLQVGDVLTIHYLNSPNAEFTYYTKSEAYAWDRVNVQPTIEYTSGDGINIDTTTNTINTDNMPASDMSEVVSPLPSVMSRRMKYSTEEQVVGEWIDGKPVYQIAKYYQGTYTVEAKATVDFGALGASNVDLVIELICTITNAADTQRYLYGHGNYIYDKTNDHVIFYSDGEWSNLRPIVTMRYTKTTD